MNNSDTAYLSLGSNRGDRLRYLQLAVAQIAAHSCIQLLHKSPIYETESVEGGGTGEFLNAVICIETSLLPEDLLILTQNIEEQLGRPAPPRQGPRCIDIDILFYGNHRAQLPNLQIPHPRMHRRPFVLAPLLDILENGAIQRTDLNW